MTDEPDAANASPHEPAPDVGLDPAPDHGPLPASDLAPAPGPGPEPESRRRRWLRRVAVTMAVLVVVTLVAAAAGVWYVARKFDRIESLPLSPVLAGGAEAPTTTTRPDQPPPPIAAEPAVNILLVGVDSAAGLAPDDPRRTEREADDVVGLRSDTTILIRLEPETGQVALLSFPRDLWVSVGGGEDRINAAMVLGGPAELIRTVTTNFGIPVDHYVQVDFAQFQRLVDAVGGVPIRIDRPLRDTHSGLWLPDPGCVTLTPEQALAYTRARQLEYLDGDTWVADPTADLGRVSRQQEFLLAALNAAIDRGARNPVTLNRLLDTAVASVVLDDGFSLGEIARLAFRFRSFDPALLERYTLPVVDADIAGRAVLVLIEDDAQPILDVFRGVPPVVVPPAEVTVTLRDGGGGPERVAALAAGLARFGFLVATGADAPAGPTALRFPLAQRNAAQTAARHLQAPLRFEVTEGDAAIEVAVGADAGGVRDKPLPPGPRLALSTARTGIVPLGDAC
jgi:LCP family protein required for cell wall assembly